MIERIAASGAQHRINAMNIGLVLCTSGAIEATNYNDIDTIVIWEMIDGDEKHSIVCDVWEYTGDPAALPAPLYGTPVDLRPYGGRCHSFQYRVEEMLDPDDPDDVDLIECEEALFPGKLVAEAPDKMRGDAGRAVDAWLDSYDFLDEELEGRVLTGNARSPVTSGATGQQENQPAAN
jgi:hypothetical protein